MNRSGFRFFHSLRVRWAEVDMQKIVFNAHYLMYFDTAMADYWRALALPYESGLQSLDGDLFVARATIDFHASARYEDQLSIGMKCDRIGNSSITFKGAIFRGEEHLITGDIIYVFADSATQKSKPVPQSFRDMLTGFESGQPMTTVRTGSWSELGTDAQRIRTEVFVQEQGIPKDLETDPQDHFALHAVAYNRLGQAVATGRMLPAQDGVSSVGRVAVDRVLRGGGVGKDVMAALIVAGRARGDKAIELHAQRTATGFYDRLGFRREGPPFEEAGIEHQTMRLEL